MSAATDFTTLLATKVDTIEKPKPLPAGHYLCQVTKYETGETRAKQTPYIRVHFKPLEPKDDIDAAAFEEFGGAAKLAEKVIQHDFYITPDALFRLRQFLETDLGISGSGKSISDCLEGMVNAVCVVKIAHKLNPAAPGEVFVNVEKTLAA